MDEEIPTPRTDRMILVDTFDNSTPILICGSKVVSAGHAMQLERELHQAKAALRQIHEIVR